MGDNWQRDKADTDRYLPEVAAILGVYLLGEPAPVEDQLHATDLTVLQVNGVRIAVRIRKFADWRDYQNEFTIRARRPSGIKTEMRKIMEGWGDLYFYGFANAERDALYDWFVGDLDVFRGWVRREVAEARAQAQARRTLPSWPWKERWNHDHSSAFFCFARAPLRAAGFEVADHRTHTLEARVAPPDWLLHIRRTRAPGANRVALGTPMG